MLIFDDDDSRLNIQLAQTEAAILQAAATLYAGYITAGSVSEGTEKNWIQKSIKQAVMMSRTIDDMIKAEGEI